MSGINRPQDHGVSVRYVFALLAFLMVLAAAVQYNDPDGPLWMAYYGVPALWSFLAAWRPELTASRPGRPLLVLSVATWAALTIWYWPPVVGWWRNEVWRMGMTDGGAAAVAEQAREGMGLMIATAVILSVLVGSFWLGPASHDGPKRAK